MSSYWTPFSPTRETDYYRPNVTLNLDRPPRPGPRQPDCWRPDRSISSSPIKREELSLSPNPDLKKQKVKQPKLPNPNKQPLGQRQEVFIKNPEVTNEAKAQNLRQPNLTNSNRQPFNDRTNRLSVDNSDRVNPGLDQKLLDQSQQGNLENETKVKKPKIKPPKLPNANLQPLGKRQMGVINSIMRVEEQNVQTKVNRDRQLVAIQAKSSITESRIKLEESDEMQSTIRILEHSPSDVNIHPERLRHILSGDTTDSSATGSSRTSLLSIPADSEANIPLNSTTKEPSPRLRQKLDFGNHVDQCLLKMDKWADAWLSNALITEDPNPETDNAWNSFEYCLSMPDILEEGEIVEYEEVPRQALPMEDIGNTNSHVHPERLAFVPGAKRKRDEEDGEQTGIDNDGDSWLEDIGRRMDSVAPEERSWSSSEGSSVPRTLTDNSSWTSIRETKSTELESSWSPEKSIKVAHIPSAATLREEARRMLQ